MHRSEKKLSCSVVQVGDLVRKAPRSGRRSAPQSWFCVVENTLRGEWQKSFRVDFQEKNLITRPPISKTFAGVSTARSKLVQQPQAGVVALRVLGELPAASCIEDHHAPACLAEHVVRVVRGVGIIQETQRVRQERPGERVAACAVRVDDVRG